MSRPNVAFLPFIPFFLGYDCEVLIRTSQSSEFGTRLLRRQSLACFLSVKGKAISSGLPILLTPAAKTQLRYPTSAPLKTIMIKFPALRPPEALFVVLSQAPHGFVLPVYCFAKQAKNATGEYGACAHRCGGPLSLRPLSPCPCNAAVPKGPTFGFFNYEDR